MSGACDSAECALPILLTESCAADANTALKPTKWLHVMSDTFSQSLQFSYSTLLVAIFRTILLMLKAVYEVAGIFRSNQWETVGCQPIEHAQPPGRNSEQNNLEPAMERH